MEIFLLLFGFCVSYLYICFILRNTSRVRCYSNDVRYSGDAVALRITPVEPALGITGARHDGGVCGLEYKCGADLI